MNDGFVMPTVLAFILITSSIILFQSVALITELYSLQAAQNNLQDIELLTNVKRNIAEIEEQESCSYQQLLVTTNYSIATNCIYTETDNQVYNNFIKRIETDDFISPQFSEQIYNFDFIMHSETSDNQVVININDNKIESNFDQKRYIIEVNSENIHQILITNLKGEILSNTPVK